MTSHLQHGGSEAETGDQGAQVHLPEEELRRLLRRVEELDALTRVARAAGQSLETWEVARTSLDQVLSIAGSDTGFILGITETGETRLLASRGLDEGLAARLEALNFGRVDDQGPMRAIDSMAALYGLGQEVKAILGAAGHSSRIVAPIPGRAAPMGLLVVINPSKESFASRSVDAMAAIGRQLGMALENARLYELSQARAKALARRSRQLSALLHTTERVVREEDLDAALETVASGLVTALDEVDGVFLWLWDPSDECLYPAAFYVPPFQEELRKVLPHSRLALGEAVPSVVFQTGQVVRQTGLSYLQSRLDATSPGVRAVIERYIGQTPEGMSRIVVPLDVAGESLGCLDLVGLRSDVQLTEEDVPVMQTFANQVAAAIQKARLIKQINDQMEELRRSQEQLVASTRLRTTVELAVGLAHEVNNALALILNGVQMARKQDLTPKLAFLLDRIASGGERIRQLVAQFSEFAPLRQRSEELGSLNTAVEDALELLAFRFKDRGIDVRKNLDEGLPSVLGDMTHLRHAVTNLLLNALEGMPDGGHVTVRTWAEDGSVMLEVADTGPGIPEEALPHIFEADFATKTEDGRLRVLRLGLFAAYNIVRAHGGEMDVQSEVGVGSTFTIRLPAAPQEASTG